MKLTDFATKDVSGISEAVRSEALDFLLAPFTNRDIAIEHWNENDMQILLGEDATSFLETTVTTPELTEYLVDGFILQFYVDDKLNGFWLINKEVR